MSRQTVLVARRIFPDIADRLRAEFEVRTHEGDAPLAREALIAALKDCDGLPQAHPASPFWATSPIRWYGIIISAVRHLFFPGRMISA